jgi:hypothetical protein
MESPFSKTKTVTMFLEPILDAITQTYIELITFSDMPPGPISNMVKIVSPRRLSEFQRYSSNCSYILLRYPVSSCCVSFDNYMTINDIPSVLSYLNSNGYIIEEGLTRMIQRGGFGNSISVFNTFSNRRTICMFSYPSTI